VRRTLVCVVVLVLSVSPAAYASEIHDAAAAGDLEAVESIVAVDGSQATAQDVRNDTPLHLAAAGGHVEVVRYLLGSGVPVDIGDNENTSPLGVAAINGHMEIAGLLIERGADVSLADDNGATPLHWAIYNGHLELASMLLDRGADPTATKTNGSTPLHGAAFYNHYENVLLLLDHGGDVHARTTGLYTPLLSAAAGQGGLDVARALVEAGADVHDRNEWGESALMLAARVGKADVVEYLIENGASIRAKSDGAGRSAIHYAAMSGDAEMLRTLLEHGAEIDERSDGGWTALSWAVLWNQIDAVEFLLNEGADTEASSDDGATPLLQALREWNPEVAEALLVHGADVNARVEQTGRTFLHHVALSGLSEGVAPALEHGAEIDAVDDAGMTPLQYAARYGNRGVADLLKDAGARTDGLEENYGRHTLLDRSVGSGEVSMWHLGHCGWALKTADHFLIFDYWNSGGDPDTPCLANGHIDPAEIRDERVYVFVTHEHTDHFDPVIFEWAESLPNVTYIFGFRPELQPPYRQEGYSGPEYTYVGPREHTRVDGMDIRTIDANDAGVGFLIEVDGLTLYHAGDHAGWAEGERDGYFAEIDYIAPFVDDLDMAFLNVTGCHAHDPDALREGTIYTIEALAPKLIIPTHAGGREHIYLQAREEAEGAGIDTPFCCPANRGDSYVYSDGRLI